ncbi:WD40/YVTN/BNR-like repeat-containing protein [Pseudoalteromonas sp. '520P1 No. 412']|uniref:WD40/YVTN/BNR-like repeat-containing protein n=1 Tax=Pseudoalteromonas sp. '520P1 No. 412' TaxID=304208 RepID=UPI0022B14AFA|nr:MULTISPECIES: YCF48-related protein [unclassified Pseudoalteromonas]
MGNQSILFKTLDAGKTWEKRYQNQDIKGFFDSIAFWDENNGLLMGDPVDGFYVIKRTKDGGKTWSRIPQNNIPKILENESAFAASGNTLIVCDNGNAWFTTGRLSASVYSSDDFGNTWQSEALPLHQESPTSGGYALALNSQKQLFVLGGDYLKRNNKYNNLERLKDNKWSKVNTGDLGLRTAMSCINNTCITTGKLATVK